MSLRDSAARKSSASNAGTTPADTWQQRTLFSNRPALPSARHPAAHSVLPATLPVDLAQSETSPSQSRKIKSPSPHSPLAKRTASVGNEIARDVTSEINHDSNHSERGDIIADLQKQIRNLETSSRCTAAETVSTGCTAFDQLLPEQGLARGTIVEWLADGPGSSAATLALIAARNACYESGSASSPSGSDALFGEGDFDVQHRSERRKMGQTPSAANRRTASTATESNRQIGTLIVVDPRKTFYPPAAAAWGIDLKNTIVLRPENTADQNWALQQALNCPAVAAVWAMIDELDERSFRRFQLAAEQSGCLGLFHRPASVRHQPSWAEIQLAVRPLPSNNTLPSGSGLPTGNFADASSQTGYRGRRLRVQLLKCRGGANGKRIELEINEATGEIRPARKQGNVASRARLMERRGRSVPAAIG